MKKQLVIDEKGNKIQKRMANLQARHLKLKEKEKDYKNFIEKLGAKELSDLDPDEIKIKLNQIVDWNDKNK
jgi:hypothetical protein